MTDLLPIDTQIAILKALKKGMSVEIKQRKDDIILLETKRQIIGSFDIPVIKN